MPGSTPKVQALKAPQIRHGTVLCDWTKRGLPGVAATTDGHSLTIQLGAGAPVSPAPQDRALSHHPVGPLATGTYQDRVTHSGLLN